jgi:hypothetical protein
VFFGCSFAKAQVDGDWRLHLLTDAPMVWFLLEFHSLKSVLLQTTVILQALLQTTVTLQVGEMMIMLGCV